MASRKAVPQAEAILIGGLWFDRTRIVNVWPVSKHRQILRRAGLWRMELAAAGTGHALGSL